MKKFLALLSFLVLLTAFSCENEPLDDGLSSGSNNNNDGLVGTWNLVEFDVTLSTSSSFSGQSVSSDVVVFSTDVDYMVEFTEVSFATNGNYTYNANVEVDGNVVTNDTFTLNDVTGNGTYSTSGEEMTIDGSFFEFNFQGMDSSVLEGEQTLTYAITDGGNTLTFTQNETITESDAATGLEVTSTTNSTSVWTRGSGSTNTCEAQAATDQAEAAYNENNTDEDLCNAYKQALENQITECGDEDGSLQAIIDDLGDCSASAVSNGTLSVNTGTLNIEFTQQTVTFENEVITVEGVSQGGSYVIYFQVTEGETGTDVLQNFVLTLNGTEYFPSTQGFDDFTSETTVSSGNVLQATFFGIVESSDGADLSLTQGMVDLSY